jgi:hypothetical protein
MRVHRVCAENLYELTAQEQRAMKGQEAGIRVPRAGSQGGVVAGGMFWFCFQKYGSGLAATFKDLKIWKQALGKGTTENSSGEYGKCGAKGSSVDCWLFFPRLWAYKKRTLSSKLFWAH